MVLRLDTPVVSGTKEVAGKVVRQSGLVIFRRADLPRMLRRAEATVAPRLHLTAEMQVGGQPGPRVYRRR